MADSRNILLFVDDCECMGGGGRGQATRKMTMAQAAWQIQVRAAIPRGGMRQSDIMNYLY